MSQTYKYVSSTFPNQWDKLTFHSTSSLTALSVNLTISFLSTSLSSRCLLWTLEVHRMFTLFLRCLSPPDLVSWWSWGKNERRTNKLRRWKNRPPVWAHRKVWGQSKSEVNVEIEGGHGGGLQQLQINFFKSIGMLSLSVFSEFLFLTFFPLLFLEMVLFPLFRCLKSLTLPTCYTFSWAASPFVKCALFFFTKKYVSAR